MRHLCDTCGFYTTHLRHQQHLCDTYGTYATAAAPVRHLRHICDTCGVYETPAAPVRHLRHICGTCGLRARMRLCACARALHISVRNRAFIYGRFPRPPSVGGLRTTPVIGGIFFWRAASFFVLGSETYDSTICQSLDHHYIPITYFWNCKFRKTSSGNRVSRCRPHSHPNHCSVPKSGPPGDPQRTDMASVTASRVHYVCCNAMRVRLVFSRLLSRLRRSLAELCRRSVSGGVGAFAKLRPHGGRGARRDGEMMGKMGYRQGYVCVR